jgi:hypothetical protein
LTFLHPFPSLLHLLLVLLHHRSAGTLLRARRWPAKQQNGRTGREGQKVSTHLHSPVSLISQIASSTAVVHPK